MTEWENIFKFSLLFFVWGFSAVFGMMMALLAVKKVCEHLGEWI